MSREFKNIDAELKSDLETQFGQKVEVVNTRPHRLFVTIDRDNLVEVIQYLKEKHGLTYLSTITGLDAVEHFEVIYHLFLDGAQINVKAIIPTDDPRIASVTPMLPIANWYEKEVSEMLGITIEGHPNPEGYMQLPEDWPEGEYPLRKNWPAKERGVR
ncbi:MAG TPA: NADH-quinone oxidoreductase subunit C [Clostridia bacterium]|jgi:NADH:ubiquinone oxidoreductase subunit C|nr:NADH-quinone oxidoreductase subunit C [Clostridia bacterium]